MCSTPGGTWADVERPCCTYLSADDHIYLGGICSFVFETFVIDLCDRIWHVSSKSRNRFLHAYHGNGPARPPKGKGKSKQNSKASNVVPPPPPVFTGENLGASSSSEQPGRSSSEAFFDGMKAAMTSVKQNDLLESRLEAERSFREQMQSALPVHLSSCAPKLVQEEWDSKVVDSKDLSAFGGVALVAKRDLPTVVARVGQTKRAVAVVTSQPAHDLYMPAAHCKEIFCSIWIQGDSGLTKISVRRFLIQLGMDVQKQVAMNTQDLDTIHENITMHKVVLRFDPVAGWDPKQLRAVIVSDYLMLSMPQSAFSNIIVREDGSATALVHASKVLSLLKKSGEAHVYCKPHVSVVEYHGLEILWLPVSINQPEALKLAKEGETLGLAVCAF